MIRYDLMDLLRPVDIYEHRSEEPVLHATFPEEFRYLTEPPLPDTKVKLTGDDDMAQMAFIDDMSIYFEANLGIASQKTNEMFEENRTRTVRVGEVIRLGLELEHFTLFFYLHQGRLRVSIKILLESVTKANAPEFVNESVKYVLREYGHRNAVRVYEPIIGQARRREGLGLGVGFEFYMDDISLPLVLKSKVAGQSIYTFQNTSDPAYEIHANDLEKFTPQTPAFVDFINDDFPGPPLLNVTLNDDVLSLDWDICSVKIHRSLGRIEVTLFGEPRDNYPPFPNSSTVREALEVANAWDRDMYAGWVDEIINDNKQDEIAFRESIPDEAKVQCRYTKYRPVYEKRRQTANGVQVLKGGCINDEDPIDLDEFEEGDMVFQTTDGICYKDEYTRETLRNRMAYEDARIRGQILSSNCFEKVERDESAFMRMSLLGLN